MPSSKDNRHLSHNSSHSRNFGGLRLERQCLGGGSSAGGSRRSGPLGQRPVPRTGVLFTLSASNRRGTSAPRMRGNDRPHPAGQRCRFCSLPRRGDASTWIIQRGSKNRRESQIAGPRKRIKGLYLRRIAEHQQQEDAEEDYPSQSFLDHGSPRGPQQHNTVSVSSRGSHLEK